MRQTKRRTRNVAGSSAVPKPKDHAPQTDTAWHIVRRTKQQERRNGLRCNDVLVFVTYRFHVSLRTFRRILRENFTPMDAAQTRVRRLLKAAHGSSAGAVFAIAFQSQAVRDAVYEESVGDARSFRAR